MSAVTHDDNAAVETLNRGATWSDAPSDDDVSFPVLSLIQQAGPLASETGKPGWWAVPGFAPIENPVVVPFRFGKARRYATNDGAGLETHCYAPVGSPAGIALSPTGPGMLCVECPLSQWGTREDGSRVPPACDEETRFLAFSADFFLPVQLIFRGTARPVGRQIAGILKARRGGMAVKLSAVKMTNDRKQVYYVPRFEVIAERTHGELWELASDAVSMARELAAGGDSAPF